MLVASLIKGGNILENIGSFHDLCIENFVGAGKLIKTHGSESYLHNKKKIAEECQR